MYHNKEELKQLVAAKLTVEEILDILEWDIYNLVDALEEQRMEQAEDFEDEVK